jgi:hypothetical protein
MNLVIFEEKIVSAYQEVLALGLTPFALMSGDDAYYIVTRYNNYIWALEYLALSKGCQWAVKEHQQMVAIMEPPLRQFLGAIELKLEKENIKLPKI